MRTCRIYGLPFLLAFLIAAIAARAQSQPDSAALRRQLTADSARIYRFKKVSFLLSLDQRNTFLATPQDYHTPFDLRGAKIGLVLYERHKTGLGLYSIRNPDTRLQRPNANDTNVRLTFNYVTLFYEYLFIHNRWWDIGVPLEFGIGRYRLSGIASGIPLPREELTVFPAGAALGVHFKPLRWFAINGMGGYRYVLDNDKNVHLSNWFYAFGLSVTTRHISEDIRYGIKKRRYKKELARIAG